MPFLFRRRIKANGDGTLQVRLSSDEREQLRVIAQQLHDMLDESVDASLRRLFPPAYADDAARDAAYQMTTGDDLRQAHLAAAETLRASADVERLQPEAANAWLHAINSARLVLGTQLDIRQEEYPVGIRRDDPNLQRWVAYEFLSLILSELVDAMSM